MDAAHRHPFLRSGFLNTYTAYSVGCIIAWAVVWAIFLLTKSRESLGYILIFFIGWLVGWTSATIGRFVYPPPKRWRPAGPTSGSKG
jgi:hypothetical protein